MEQRGTYRVDDPRGTVPSGGIDSSPQVEEEDGSNTSTIQVVLGVFCRTDNVDVGTNSIHAGGSADGTTEEELTTSELINQKEQPDNGEDSLDDTKDTIENTLSVASNTKTGEDSRAVVVDGVDTGRVLPEEQHATQEEAVLQARRLEDSLEGLPEAQTNSSNLLLDGLVNSSHLLGDVNISFIELTNPAEVLHGLLATTLEE